MSGCANEILTRLACKLDKKLHPIKSFLFGYDINRVAIYRTRLVEKSIIVVLGNMLTSQCQAYEVLESGLKVMMYSKRQLTQKQYDAIREVLKDLRGQ